MIRLKSQSTLYIIQIITFLKESTVLTATEDEMKWSGLEEKSRHFIGYLDDAPYAVSVSNEQTMIPDTAFTDLRALFPVMNMQLFEAISRAFQIVNWSIPAIAAFADQNLSR